VRKYKIVEGEVSVQGSQAWLDFRRDKVGASDASAVFGTNYFTSRQKLLESKISGAIVTPNAAMQRGTLLEPVARDYINQLTNSDYKPALIQSIEYPSLFASLDGYWEKEDGEVVILEIKVPGKSSHSCALEGRVPGIYIQQLDHQLLVSGLDFVIYFSFDGDTGVSVRHERNQARIDELLTAELEFLVDLDELRQQEPLELDWLEQYDRWCLQLNQKRPDE